jgi:hypothetical protein
MKDIRECYIDKIAKDKEGQPLKRWLTKTGYNNLMESDKNRLIKQENIKVSIPKEFINVTENKSNKPKDGQGIGNVGKGRPKTKQIDKDSSTGENINS